MFVADCRRYIVAILNSRNDPVLTCGVDKYKNTVLFFFRMGRHWSLLAGSRIDCKPRSSGNCHRVASKQHAYVCRWGRTVQLLHHHQMRGGSDSRSSTVCADMWGLVMSGASSYASRLTGINSLRLWSSLKRYKLWVFVWDFVGFTKYVHTLAQVLCDFVWFGVVEVHLVGLTFLWCHDLEEYMCVDSIGQTVVSLVVVYLLTLPYLMVIY